MTKLFTKEYEEYIGEMIRKISTKEIADGRYKDTEIIITGETFIGLLHMVSYFWAYAELNMNEEQSEQHLQLSSDVAERLIEEYTISTDFEELDERILH